MNLVDFNVDSVRHLLSPPTVNPPFLATLHFLLSATPAPPREIIPLPQTFL
jgi:hypothetical protein